MRMLLAIFVVAVIASAVGLLPETDRCKEDGVGCAQSDTTATDEDTTPSEEDSGPVQLDGNTCRMRNDVIACTNDVSGETCLADTTDGTGQPACVDADGDYYQP